jgi:ATP-dependent DNA helicase RecG
MKVADVQRIVTSGESEHLEFKKSTGQRTEAAKTICAMLNGQGGQVIFGVTDRGEIVGQKVTTRTIEDLAHEFRRIDPQVTPVVETVDIGGGLAVIVVTVPAGGGPYTYDDRPYIRSGPVTQRMDKHQYELRLTERMHPKTRWELLPVPRGVTIADLDAEEVQVTLDNAVRIGRMDRPRRADTRSILTGLKLIEDGKLINAALVLYGKSSKVENIFPQFAIRMARFRGITKVADFADNRQYWGNAFDLLRRAESFLLDHVPIAGKVVPEQFRRIDQPWYPPRATREALANALCHRDYTSHGGAISLAMYDDRIEIENPNGLHFGFTPEKLTRPHDSQPWNPRIAEVFYRAGVIEKWGTGTINILDWCKENGNSPPKWETREPGEVVVTFWPVKGQQESQLESRLESRPESVRDKVLLLLSIGPSSKSELASKLGQKRPSGQLHKVINELFDEGLIAYTVPEKPNSRLQKYRLAKKR